MEFTHPTPTIPRTINIVALGPTNADYHSAHFSYNPVVPEVDDVWTLNKGFRTTRAGVVFVLDDLVGECRKSERYRRELNNLRVPIITSIIDDDILELLPDAQLVKYPIHQVVDFYGQRWLESRDRLSPVSWSLSSSPVPWEPKDYTQEEIRNAGRRYASYMRNSIPMILAYAGFIGIRTINLFGADYDFPGAAVHEAGKPNCEYWVALIAGLLGVEVNLPSRSTLLSINQGRDIYGYGARQPIL